MKLISNDVAGQKVAEAVTDPAPRPSRRTFTAAYKADVVAEYEAAPRGEKSAVLRREGLYHSHIKEWSAACDSGALAGLGGAGGSTRPSGRKSSDRAEADRLRAENQRLSRQLTQAKAALDIMGKAHVLLETLAESTDTTSTSRRS